MHAAVARYFLYYPTVFLRREPVARLLREYEASQYWAPSRLTEFQIAHLRNLLKIAVTRSTFHNARLRAATSDADGLAALLAKITPMSKMDLIEHNDRIITRKSRFDDVKTTGGSTGQAVQIRKNSHSLARERAATWRAYRWAGVTVGDPQARFWGVPLTQQNRLKFKAVDFISNRVRLSAFDISDETMAAYHRQIMAFKPAYLYGYVSAIREFVGYLAKRRLQLPASVRSIITTSEVLTKEIRTELETRSGLKVFNEYGCGEVGSIAHECEAGGLHIMAENLIVESDAPASGQAGELIVTDLHNVVTPLIRYRLGDYGTLSNRACACGRTLPLIDNIHGRAYDLIILPDGRKIHPELLMYVFEEFKAESGAITQFQAMQTAPDKFRLRLVLGESSREADIEAHLSARISEVLQMTPQIEFEYVPAIERERSGKMRLIKRTFE